MDDDIACFPNNCINANSKQYAELKYEVITHFSTETNPSMRQFLSKISASDIVQIKEPPILSFFDHIFAYNSPSEHHSNFWKRVSQWVRSEFSQQGISNKNEIVTENVNSKSLNYSAYNLLFHNLSVVCTLVSWVCVVILFLLHITSIHFSTFRLVFVTFFVCPLAVAILESAFQYLYLMYTIGHWKFMKVGVS